MLESAIAGVVIRSLKRHTDSRGWLMELFRSDETAEGVFPVMGYISVTHPGVARGPHEHRDQADTFCFASGDYELTIWENRSGRPKRKEVYHFGEESPAYVVIPPGVVHAYRNVGDSDAFVLNFPNRLYAGRGRSEPVDEIRHEEIDSEFRLE